MAYPHDLDPEGLRLPVKLDGTSNGEYVPLPITAGQRLANRLAQAEASENARRLGLSRRRFMVSAMGTATVLAACNRANPGAGGAYVLAKVAPLDDAAATASVGGEEFIVVVEIHCVDP